jgi:hypothetical protein
MALTLVAAVAEHCLEAEKFLRAKNALSEHSRWELCPKKNFLQIFLLKKVYFSNFANR